MTRVQLPGGAVLAFAQMDDLSRAQRALHNAYRRGVARCLCTPNGVELAICRLQAANGVRYYLRSLPSVSHDHRTDCLFGPAAEREAAAPFVRSSEEVHLEGGLRTRVLTEAPPTEIAPHPCSAGGARASSQTYVGLARELIARASLDVYVPGAELNAAGVWSALLAATRGIRTDAGAFSDLVLPVVPGGAPAATSALLDDVRAKLSSDDRRRRIIIGEVGAWARPRGTVGRVFVKGLERETGWHVAAHADVVDAIAARYAMAVSLLGKTEATQTRVLLCGSCDLEQQTRTLWLRYGGLLATVRPCIPIESSYEREVALALIAERRHFRKPYLPGGDFIPDFEVLDRGERPLVMEVFGMETAAYVARMREKIRVYDARFGVGKWWYWMAPTSAMPPLP